MIKEAVEFAVEAHRGAVRKGTQVPYIVHPLEAAVIVGSMTGDEELIAAAVLHDVLEDTDATEEELRRRFGDRVTDLVVAETDDKRKSWMERKRNKLVRAREAGRELQILMLADKLSNIRSMARDYLLLGEAFWQRFNRKDKEAHAWYYWGMADSLRSLEDCDQYREYVGLCRKVFGERREDGARRPSDQGQADGG